MSQRLNVERERNRAMKRLICLAMLIVFFAASYYISPVVCAQQSNPNEKCCCKFRVDDRDSYFWMTMGECNKKKGNFVLFGPAPGSGVSPEAMCRGLSGPR